MKPSFFTRWQSNFWAGLAIVFPTVISLAVLRWLFESVANITNTLLIFLPWKLTHQDQGQGPMYWYWSLVALVLAVILIGTVGFLARYYFGKQVIQSVDQTMLRVPLLNKIYAAIKQVNDAFTTGSKTSFRTVALVEYPRPGMYSVCFITSEQHDEAESKIGERLVSIFIPTTPNPTSGFLLLVPADKVMKLEMSVADGIKYIISLGAISPENRAAAVRELAHPTPVPHVLPVAAQPADPQSLNAGGG